MDSQEKQCQSFEEAERQILDETRPQWRRNAVDALEGVLAVSPASKGRYLKRDADVSDGAWAKLQKVDAVVQALAPYESAVYAVALDAAHARVFLLNGAEGRWLRIGALYRMLDAAGSLGIWPDRTPVALLEIEDGGAETIPVEELLRMDNSEIVEKLHGSDGDDA